MGGTLETIALVTGIIGNLFGIGSALFGGKVKIPEPPPIKIPEADLQNLTAQIEANKTITDEVRKGIIQNLQNYNRGILSDTYAQLYNTYADRLWKETVMRVNQEAAARGFSPGSTEYNRMMQEAMVVVNNELAKMKAELLERQLNNALSSAGLAETTINELKQKWAMEMQAQELEQTRYKNVLDYQKLGMAQRAWQAQALREGFKGLATSFNKLGDFLKTPEKTPEGTPKLTLPKPQMEYRWETPKLEVPGMDKAFENWEKGKFLKD